jgi:flagellar protein FliO/FliZ
METIFGAEMPVAAKVLLALLIVIGLAGGVFYLVRTIGASRFGSATLRGRQPRLALIEVAGIDTRRSLVLIRRDNVEHLLMIGGPSDLVVESNILRAIAVGAARDSAQARPPAEPARPMPDANLWPPPETTPRPSRPVAPSAPSVAAAAAMSEETWPPPQLQAEPVSRVSHAADHLAGLAAELGRAPAAGELGRAPAAGELGRAPAPAEPGRASVAPGDNPPREPKRPVVQPVSQVAPAASATATDQNLTEMAQRLEAALRQAPAGARLGEPGGRASEPAAKPPEPAAAPPRVNGTNGSTGESPRLAGGEPPRLAGELRATRPDAKPGAPKQVYDNLEQEMASLLGRPAGKT